MAPVVPMTSRTDEERQRLVAFMHGADSVELKLSVPESTQRSALEALDLDPVQAKVRQAFFLDTPDLALDRQGLVLRLRRSQGKADDTVVQLRPMVPPSELRRSIRRSASFGLEVDLSPGGFACSGSMKGTVAPGGVRDAMAGRRSVWTLFSKEQHALFAAYAREDMDVHDICVLGPILLLRLRHSPPGFARRLVAEMWLFPDGSRTVELSTRCEPSDAFQVAAETRAFLASRGVDCDGEQQTKTRNALEFFARRLDRRLVVDAVTR
jgi:hypothetical protein